MEHTLATPLTPFNYDKGFMQLVYVTPSTPHIYINKGIKIQILIKNIFKTFLNTSLSKG